MCFEPDSQPPIRPLSGAAISHDDLVLEAADGNCFAAFVAVPDEPSDAGVVVLPDVRGLYRFYGRPGRGQDGSPGPTERAGELRAPILALMGGDDPAIAAEEIAAFDAALDEAGVVHEVVTYPGAPHSFFDRRYEEFAEASEDAWRRLLGFLERHGG